MRLLLDTHLLIWAVGYSSRLPSAARTLLDDSNNSLSFSSASIWEIAIKAGKNAPDFQINPNTMRFGLLANGYLELAVSSEHAIATLGLPTIHKDPFDRILIAQAKVEGITLLTVDAAIARYPGSILKL